MPGLGSSGVFVESSTENLTPSKRTSPLNVPNQRYPSGVCVMAVAEFSGSPSSVCQLVTTYSGSYVVLWANAGGASKRRIASSVVRHEARLMWVALRVGAGLLRSRWVLTGRDYCRVRGRSMVSSPSAALRAAQPNQPLRNRPSRTLEVRSKTSSKLPMPSTFTTPWSWLYFSMTGTVLVSCSARRCTILAVALS